jgi:hypothetical protein
LFGEEEGKEELEGGESYYDGTSGDLTAPAAMKRKRWRKTMVMKECFSAA